MEEEGFCCKRKGAACKRGAMGKAMGSTSCLKGSILKKAKEGAKLMSQNLRQGGCLSKQQSSVWLGKNSI